MIVDAHAVAGGYFIRQDPMGFPELFAAMRKTGVDLSAVMSLRALHADARKGNDYLFSAAANDSRIIPIGVVAPNVSHFDVPDLVADCVDNGAAGLALFLSGQLVSLSSLSFRKTLAEAAKPGLPVIVTGARASGTLTELAELTRGLGCALLIVAPYYGLLGELLAVLQEHPHVYTDTSWQITPGCIELLVEHAGPDRVLFGSGAPIRPIHPALNMVLDAEIDDATKQKILAANALRLFGRRAEAERLEASPVSLPEPKMPSTPPVDVHCHLGVAPDIPMPLRDVESIEHYVERAGIEFAVCSSPVAYREDIDWGNREMLDKIKGRPRLLGSPTISPTHMEESIRWLDMCARDDRLAHATLDPDNEGEPFGSDRYMRLFEEAARREVPIFWNSGAQDYVRGVRWQRKLGYIPWIRGAGPDEIAMFLEVGRRHPDLPIILGHGLGEDGVRLAQQTRNIYLELSGSYPERDALRKAIDGAGKERVVFGTDLDLISPAFALGVYYEADMSTEEERLVMAENARRILRLPGK